MRIKVIEVGSKEYEAMVDLRLRVLLDPVGVPRSYVDPEKEKKDILVAAFEDDVMTGCCILSHVDDTTIQLRQMAVETSAQQKGIGAAVISFAEQLALEKGYQKLMMHARDSVIRFYEKCGYHIAGEQFFEVGIAHHKMEKQLTS